MEIRQPEAIKTQALMRPSSSVYGGARSEAANHAARVICESRTTYRPKTKPALRRVIGANQHHGQKCTIAALTGQWI